MREIKPKLKNKNKSKSKKSTKLLVGLSCLATATVLTFCGAFLGFDSTTGKKSDNNTYISGYNISGMNQKQATTYLTEQYTSKLQDLKITINHGDKKYEYTSADFNPNTNLHTIIDSAYDRNSETAEFISNKDLIVKDGNVCVTLDYLLPTLDDKIDEIASMIETKAQDSTITFNPDAEEKFTITDEVIGSVINREKLKNDLNEQFTVSNNLNVEIEMIPAYPLVTKEDNTKLTYQIVNFTTNVADSTGNRKLNVKRALQDFNGMTIKPKESISFNNITCPHTTANGYKIAKVIVNNKFVDGVGGGICQASTTLYNALLRAGMQIDEVHKHSLPVHYVPLALDAMVSGNSDLRFTNNTEYPIFIQTYATDTLVGVKVYSHSLEYEYKPTSTTISEIPALPDIIKYDVDNEYSDKVLFVGEKYRLSWGQKGYEVKAYMNKYKDGKLIDTYLIRHEIYQPTAGTVIEGAKSLPTGIKPILD